MQAQHVGIILDGNRRYARSLGLRTLDGHSQGADKVQQLIEHWALELGIKELTLYTFSMQNFKRAKSEVNYLMDLFVKFFKKFMKLIKEKKRNIKINFIGRIHLFPKRVQEVMKEIINLTKKNSKLVVNFAMGYGGREEIVDGIKHLVKDVKEKKVSEESIDEKLFTNYLGLQHEPDLIIRTGGDRRTSNFLMWQSSYSEWFFLDKFWPQIEKEDLVKVLEEFNARERRFGR
tara:strand:- start:86 stop:781 length:696 start_codon:yes stop_codon:yes gene_type:complete